MNRKYYFINKFETNNIDKIDYLDIINKLFIAASISTKPGSSHNDVEITQILLEIYS